MDMMNDEIRVFTPSGMLGYGIPAESMARGAALSPHVVTIDSGSTDSGPQKLGLGSMTCSREAYIKDISLILRQAVPKRIPVFISSAGGDGTNAHVDEFVDIVRAFAAEHDTRLRVATIYADIAKDEIKRRLGQGQVQPCGPVPSLTETEIDAASNIVAQMGVEPYLAALGGAPELDVIISGRTYDPVPMAVLGLRAGFDPGLCWHMGKIMECGAVCAEPKGRSIFGTLRRNGFELEPINPAERCTTLSVAAHTLYEKSHPWLLPGPGGVLDLSGAIYEQVTDRRVRVAGGVFVPNRYTVKLEGAKVIGHRSIFIAGARDPIFIAALAGVFERVRQTVRDFAPELSPDSYQLIFHQYGRNGVMAEREPLQHVVSHELGIIGEVAAPTQAIADALCNRARVALMHLSYPGQRATAGNIASPFTPLEIPLGQVCAFNIYHLSRASRNQRG